MKLSTSLICSLVVFVASSASAAKPTVSTIHSFPNDTWVENIAVREDGNLLVTLLTAPDLYMIDPLNSIKAAVLVHSFSSQTSLVGISEIGFDKFAVAAINFTFATKKVAPGSSAVYVVDLTGFRSLANGKVQNPAKVTKVVTIPDAGLFNGMTTLSSDSVLVADSSRGLVYRVNTETGEYTTVLSDKLLAPTPSSPIGPLGVNGIRLHDSTLYFTNTDKGYFAKVPLNVNGTAAGPFHVIAKKLDPVDDFTVSTEGVAWVTGTNRLQKITPDGNVTLYVGGEHKLVLEGDTSAAFGRTSSDCNTIYITTNGGLGGSVRGVINGGKVLAVFAD